MCYNSTMKRTKIKFQGNNYDGVVYMLHPGQEQLNEIASILKNDYVRKHSLIQDSSIKVNASRIDDFHAIVRVVNERNGVLKSFLLFATDRARYPTVDLVVAMNNRAQTLFEEDGVYGLKGIRDPKLLDNIVESTKNSVYFGEDQIPSILRKATQYWWKLAHYQVFSNGNKRTGLLVAGFFAKINFMSIQFDQDKMYEKSKAIAKNELTEKELYEFLLTVVSFDYAAIANDYLHPKHS